MDTVCKSQTYAGNNYDLLRIDTTHVRLTARVQRRPCIARGRRLDASDVICASCVACRSGPDTDAYRSSGMSVADSLEATDGQSALTEHKRGADAEQERCS
eukprot:COSAG02_NODE_1_length_108762_cov_456.708287_30_plen_101_part_00